MEAVHQLGSALARQWEARDFDEEAFPEVAMRELGVPALDALSPTELFRWVQTGASLPQQRWREPLPTGPVLTLYHHEKFCLEALFWLEGQPDIHHHAFTGAFRVLLGEAIQVRYRFEPRERVNARLTMGDLCATGARTLAAGEIESFQSGAGFLHALFHLARPTVTLVARTHPLEKMIDLRYLPPGLAVAPTPPSEQLRRQLQLLEMLHAAGEPRHLQELHALLRRAEFHEAFLLLFHHGFASLDTPRFEEAVAVARKLHGEAVQHWFPLFSQRRLAQRIQALLRAERREEHRFVLASLLVAARRALFLELIAGRFSGQPPEQLAARCLQEAGLGGGLDSLLD